MSELPIGSNYNVVVIHPNVLKAAAEIKNKNNKAKTQDNPEALVNSLDSMSASMRAKIQMQKKEAEYNKKINTMIGIIKDSMPDIDYDSLITTAEEMVDNGAYDELQEETNRQIKEILASSIENVIEDKEPISIVKLEEKMKNQEE